MATPSYIAAFKSKILHKKVSQAHEMLSACALCPRKCGVNRLKDSLGLCRTGKNAYVCSYFAHHGEEPVLSGTRGAGNIFFGNCNLKCIFCQNYEISQNSKGVDIYS